jgi:glycosyltransferase involved in cell wall biosynthesis
VTLEALVRHAAAAGWDQHVVAGVPAEDPSPEVGGLGAERLHPLVFSTPELPFPVPGMSDVMPYASTRFSAMSREQLALYRTAWRRHLAGVLAAVEPDVIHSHHVWLMSSLVKDLAPGTPVVTQCHATGLRQMSLCPHLAEEVRQGCRRNDRFLVLHREHARALAESLGVAAERIRVVGAGFREELFHSRGRAEDAAGRILYVGKLSAAKGLPWLLDAFERLERRRGEPGASSRLELHIAGSGAGEEADALRRRMEAMSGVVLHGHLDQWALAGWMRRSSVCVLPSLYEGLPLVLVEALACGCRLVATDLPGVTEQLAPHLGEALELVPLPRLVTVDTPAQEDLPAFVERLADALAAALGKPPLAAAAEPPEALTWAAVFRRIEAVWLELVTSGS